MEKLINKILILYKKHLDIDSKQEAILKYSLKLLISSIEGYVLALVIAWALGIFPYVLIAMVTVSTLRVFSGGAHCSNATNCILYGAITMNALGALSRIIEFSKITELVFISLIFSYGLWAIRKYAPADTPGKPISTKLQKDRLRRRSALVACIWAVLAFALTFGYREQGHILTYASSIGILWQSFTLTNIGYKLCHAMDRILSRMLMRKGEPSC
ncbi:accessory gene regulator ArgB-like protein [Geosporobacter ferrireducens]|uniref:Accessory regulator AgrB n=1 Tax=Geosporobacter ferrireducens TaxID=1424294 RepID=A0A1D8GCK2_9FIRM|nr:accessory gene regulator B family protein [Geosporobacter ferrireducens]AOT68622.1 hypothetical protein Gferi_02825 [Geosporobacter ferrireducens]MTI54094.1 hypothetical protein [Geosporobacter ferrireducens]